jgi:hypothetical protein
MRWRLRQRRQQLPASVPGSRLTTADPAARGARAERPSAELSPLSRSERAAARFNASEAGHTVRGLVRTLGVPWVSVGASAGTAEEVRITVAWELSWYQWGVDLEDEARPVFELGKGREIGQIDAAARQWNASASEQGELLLGRPEADRDRP